MTPLHVVVILASLAAPLICGMSPACSQSLPAILQLSTMTIAGALGHAGSHKGRERLRDDPGERGTLALPREPEYDSSPNNRRKT